MRSSSWLVSRPMRGDLEDGRRYRCSRASKIEWEIEGIEGSSFRPRVTRVLSYSEADRGGSGGKGEGKRITRPSSQVRGGVREG
jgi:hypothetical protein